MDYAYIGKVEKSKIYASEPERITFDSFEVRLDGDNGAAHDVRFIKGKWTCDCNYFQSRGFCSHTMAMERVLGNMLAKTPSA
ncbi:MAG: SWIM zinc finger family protein [Chloroflexota bacterium]